MSTRSLRSRPSRDNILSTQDSNMNTRTTRLSRAATSPSITVARSPSGSPTEPTRSIRLTLKMPSSKLREVTSANSRDATTSKRSVNIFRDNPVMSGPRSSRTRRRIVEVDTSDEDDIKDQEEDEVDDDEPAGDDGEDVDPDGDVDMDDAPPKPPASRRNTKATATPTHGRGAKSVEAKEMELHEDDEDDEDELSDLESDGDGDLGDHDESGVPDEAGNADGGGLDEEDELDEIDSDIEGGDPKMTKRQRGSLGNDFLQLPMEPQVKKHLTAEERAMRRAEMARRRKNLSEKRNEEEKMDTINRLLRKQAPKRRGRVSAAEAAIATPAEQEEQPEGERPDPTVVRWVSNREGCRIGVPVEWFGTPAGNLFGELPKGNRRLVEEV